MPTLSLCMIVKDEESTLPGCLASVRDFVDEIVIVDTGSTDGTPEIAAANGATKVIHRNPSTDPTWFIRDDATSGGPGPYTSKPFLANFGAARNVAWSEAAGDYLLWLDADDLVKGAEHLPAILAEMERDGIAVARMRYDVAGLDVWRERIVKRGAGEWRGAIHETVATRGPERRFAACHVEHHRPDRPRVAHRNYKVLRHVLATEGETPRTLFYLADESRWFDQARSLEHVEKFLGLWAWTADRGFGFMLAGRLHEEKGRTSGNYDAAFRAYAAATVEAPTMPDGWFGLARLAYYYQRWAECVAWTEKGFALGDPEGVPFSNPNWWTRAWERKGEPHVYLNVALSKLGRQAEAHESCKAGLAVWGEHAQLRANLAWYEKKAA